VAVVLEVQAEDRVQCMYPRLSVILSPVPSLTASRTPAAGSLPLESLHYCHLGGPPDGDGLTLAARGTPEQRPLHRRCRRCRYWAVHV